MLKMTDADLDTTVKDEKYLLTVRALRDRNFKNQLPFLILSDQLPDGQVYREFPDGHIELQEVSFSGANFEATLIKTLTSSEADKVRHKNGLF
jgi:hypothetical protein